MKVLLLSFYFEPDLCAGSFRASALVDKLKNFKELEIDVFTTMPNRYSNYSAEAAIKEKLYDNVSIYRINTYSDKNGLLEQLLSFYSYFVGSRKNLKGKSYLLTNII